MHEEVFWQHYFFRILYIRLKLGIEIIDVESPLLPIKQIPEDDILYKPTFVPPPKPVKPVVISGLSPGSKPMTPSSSSSQIVHETSPVAQEDNEEEEDEEVDETAKKELEIRRKEEKALAAEVEGFLDNDDLDLGDLDEGRKKKKETTSVLCVYLSDMSDIHLWLDFPSFFVFVFVCLVFVCVLINNR